MLEEQCIEFVCSLSSQIQYSYYHTLKTVLFVCMCHGVKF